MKVAVVGHVELVEFIRVARVPRPGEIVHARDAFEEPAGGGGVAAVQLARLAGACTLFTALGDDVRGRSIPPRLADLGVRVEAAWRPPPQRRGITFLDDAAERTITVIGARHQPEPSDPLPWHELDDVDAVYFTAGSVETLRLARRAKVLVATTRTLPVLEAAGLELDAVVRSASDPNEPDAIGRARARLHVATEGAHGGSFICADGGRGRFRAEALPGPAVDAYGCGDSFAAGLTFALGQRLPVDEALAFAARCGAACITGRGPYEGQLRAENALVKPDER